MRLSFNCFKYGFVYFIDLLLVELRLKKKLSNYSNLKRQSYFMKLDEKEYERELSIWFKKNTKGLVCDFNNPQRFTEKIQWLKLYDNKKIGIKTRLADKFLVRTWIKDIIGEDYLIDLIAAYDDFNQIDFEKLPESFVIKYNHGAKMNILVKNKENIDKKDLINKLKYWKKINYAFYDGSFQLQYKDIKPKILIEKYMKNGNKDCLVDYKFYCFDGKPLYCQVISERTKEETISFFDIDWNKINVVGLGCHNIEKNKIEKPESYDEMIGIAKKLSQGFEFVRVDLYDIDGKCYFGEMTFTPASGGGYFIPDSFDYELGKKITISSKGE